MCLCRKRDVFYGGALQSEHSLTASVIRSSSVVSLQTTYWFHLKPFRTIMKGQKQQGWSWSANECPLLMKYLFKSTRNIWIKCGRITELRKIFKKHIKNNKYWKKLIISCFLLGSTDRTRNTLLNTLFALNNDHFTRPETGSFRFQARRCDFLTSLDDTNLSISNMRTESFSGRNSGSTRSCCTKLFPLRRRRRAESVCRYRAVTGLPGVMLLCPAVSLTDAHRR